MEPTRDFTDRLESRIVNELRRRNSEARVPRWAAWTPKQAFATLAIIIVVSMGIGGAAVAATYEVQQTQARNQIAAMVEQRLVLAQARLTLAKEEQDRAQRRFAVGIEGPTAPAEKGIAVAEAEAEVARLALDLEEVRLTGREPRREVSAPRVSGRDFVGERLQVDLRMPTMALEAVEQVAADVQRRVEIGTSAPLDLDEVRSRVFDIQAGLALIERKADIRRQVIAGKMDGQEAELRVLEAEAEQRVKALTPKVDLARKQMASVEQRFAVGVATSVDLGEARLRTLGSEMELAKAQLDLTVIRKRLEERKK